MIRPFRSTMALMAAAALLAAGLGTAAFAQGHGKGDRGFGPGHRMFPLGQLELTDAQRGQVRDVMQRHREEMQEVGKRLRTAHQTQREAVETVPVNEALIRSTSQSLAAAQTDMALLQARIHSDIWTLLTPDQQAKAKELKEKRGAKMKERAEGRRQK